MASKSPPARPSAAPAFFVVGVLILLIGLFAQPLVVAPAGGFVVLLAGIAWARDSQRRSVPDSDPETAHPILAAEAEQTDGRTLSRATLLLGGLLGLIVVVPVAGFAVVPSLLRQRRHTVDIGPLTDFPEGEFTVIRFLLDPTQGEISRRAAYVRNNGLLGAQPSFTIMSSRCTHVGCPTQPNGPLFSAQARNVHTSAGDVSIIPALPAGFGCPCHGSQFDTEGNRTAGPAPRALDRYEFSIRDGHVLLGRPFSVSHVDGSGAQARIHSVPLEPPGEPATGPESLLYPLEPPS